MPLTMRLIGLVYEDIAGTTDDYLVLDDGVEVGRVQRDVTHDTRWIWTNKVIPNQASDRGEADSRGEAAAAFRARWDALTEAEKDTARGWRVSSTSVPLNPIPIPPRR